MSDDHDDHDDQAAVSAGVADDLIRGVAAFMDHLDQLRKGGDPGHALAALTWTALQLAERAQMYAYGVIDEGDVPRFLSLDGALFDASGTIVRIDAEQDRWRYLSAAWAKSLDVVDGDAL